MLQQASVVDAPVALLESVFVSVALHMGRQEHVNSREMAVGDVPQPPVCGPHRGSRGRLPTGGPVPSASWESLDTVFLEDVFLERVPILKSCPHFLRGRLLQSFDLALRERHRAQLAGDPVSENRAWKLFGLIPRLLHRPRGTSSVGRDELCFRADQFAAGEWVSLVDTSRPLSVARPGKGNAMSEEERRGKAAQNSSSGDRCLGPGTN